MENFIFRLVVGLIITIGLAIYASRYPALYLEKFNELLFMPAGIIFGSLSAYFGVKYLPSSILDSIGVTCTNFDFSYLLVYAGIGAVLLIYLYILNHLNN